MKTKSLSERHKRNLTYGGFFAVFFLFWVFVFYCAPMTADDIFFWTLRLKGFNNIFNYALSYGNGRLLGNLGVYYLVEYIHLRVFVKAICFTILPVLIIRVLRISNPISRIVTVVLILCVSPGIFAQAAAWTAGFQNYVPPIILFLLGFILVEMSASKNRAGKFVICVAVFLCGLAMQLYVEHSSCINLILAFVLVVYACRVKKELFAGAFTFLIAAALGAVLMFMIPKWFCSDYGLMIGYRKFNFAGGIMKTIYGMVKNGVKLVSMYSENTVAFAALALGQTVLLHKTAKSSRNHLLFVGLWLPVAFFFACHVASLSRWYGKLAVAESVCLVLFMCMFLAGFVASAVVVLRAGLEKRLLVSYFLIFMAIFSLGPFLFVEPIGYRSLMHSYVFLVAADVMLLDCALSRITLEKPISCIYMYIKAGVCALVVVCMLSLCAVFADTARICSVRDSYIEEQVNAGAEKIDYFVLPGEYIFDYWVEHAHNSYYETMHGKPVELSLMTAEEWINTHYYFYYE